MCKVAIIPEKVLSHVLLSHLGKQAWSGDVAPMSPSCSGENWEPGFLAPWLVTGAA